MSAFSFDSYFGSRNIALLVDPDKDLLNEDFIDIINLSKPNFILIGGSQPFPIEKLIHSISLLKERTEIPILGFPGNNKQIDQRMDALLALSVIQSTDSEYILRQLIDSATELRQLSLVTFFTPYIILNYTGTTSVEILLKDKIEQIESLERFENYIDTIKILNPCCFYLEAGSGSLYSIHPEWINLASRKLNRIFSFVGGGIDTLEKAELAWNSGANCIVLGNTIEKAPYLLSDFCKLR